MVIRASMFDYAVQEQIAKLEANIVRYPHIHDKESKFTEKEKIEYAINKAKKYDEVDWQAMAIVTFFFWWIVAPVFSIRRGIQWVAKKKFKIFTISKFENRLKELDQIDQLKKQAIEDKKKYQEALNLLKAEGIDVGE